MNKCPFEVMRLPKNKKPCLLVWTDEKHIKKVASFNDDESAKLFAKIFNEFVDTVYFDGGKHENQT